jgi:hypothetical protein
MAGLGSGLGRAQKRLRGDASPVGALAPDQLALDQRGSEPEPGEPRGSDLAGRTGPDHHRVEPIGHL